MDATINLGQLITVVFFILGTVLLVVLIIAVIHLIKILMNVNRMIIKNKVYIDNTMEKIPAITDNVSKMSDIVRDEMENIQKIMTNVGKASESAKDAVEIIKKDIIIKAKNILDLLDWVRKFFKNKQDKPKKKEKDIVYRYTYKKGHKNPDIVIEEPITSDNTTSDNTTSDETTMDENAASEESTVKDSGAVDQTNAVRQ